MAENLRPAVRTQKERNAEASAAQRRREGYAEAIANGDTTTAPLVNIEDARYVSKIAPPLLVWLARILAQHEVLEPAWRQVTADVRAATKKRDEAKHQLDAVRKKAEEAREDFKVRPQPQLPAGMQHVVEEAEGGRHRHEVDSGGRQAA